MDETVIQKGYPNKRSITKGTSPFYRSWIKKYLLKILYSDIEYLNGDQTFRPIPFLLKENHQFDVTIYLHDGLCR